MRPALIALATVSLLVALRHSTTLPMYDYARMHVFLHHQEMTALAERFLLVPEIDFAFLDEGRVEASSHSEFRVSLSEDDRRDLTRLFASADVGHIFRASAGHAFMELGPIKRSGRTFYIALSLSPGVESEPCTGQWSEQEKGSCHYLLESEWQLNYLWHPPVWPAAQQGAAADPAMRRSN